MRETVWRTLTEACAPGARLLDLGCGTGIDAIELARRGYAVLATDWSPQMVERTRARAAEAGLSDRVTTAHMGLQELDRLRNADPSTPFDSAQGNSSRAAGGKGGEQFDGIYSNFGPLNCAPNLEAVARSCAALLRPGGKLVFSVIGRICPWEFGYYMLRGRLARAGWPRNM